MPIVVNLAGGWEADALVTLTTVRRYLMLPSPTEASTHDDLLNILISGCSVKFQQAAGGRVFTQASMTEYHDGDGLSGTFRVANPPIASSPAPQLWCDPDFGFGDATAYTINDDFQFDPDTGIVKLRFNVFTAGLRSIKIIYTGGFSSIPDDVQAAVAEWVCERFRMAQDKRWGLSGKSQAEFGVNFIGEPVPRSVLDVARHYKRRYWSP